MTEETQNTEREKSREESDKNCIMQIGNVVRGWCESTETDIAQMTAHF